MNIHDFIGYYFIVALIFGIIIFLILVMSLMSDSEGYSKRENFLFCILTALTAVGWPVLIIYLFYLDHKDKERVSKNKRFYKKCCRYFMNAQIANTFVSRVLNFIEILYYAADDMDYNGAAVILTWYTPNGSRMEMICDESENARITIIPYYNFIKKNNDMINDCKIQNTYCYTESDGIKSINRIVEDFVDKVYEDKYKGDSK